MIIDTKYARKNEGIYYGDGSADLAESVARAVYGKTTAKAQAEAAHKAICRFAEKVGHNPDMECFIRKEDRNYYRVSYEAGPYDWAVVASDAIGQVGILAEPYYSFDLCFYGEIR